MRLLWIASSVASALALVATDTVGGAPPNVSTTVHPINATLDLDVGTDCGTGAPTLITGSYSGVVHVLLRTDGTVHINGAVQGSATNDDLPADGTPDATTTFQSTFGDTFRSTGSENHRFILNGSGTTTATGATFRFHVLIQLLLDQNGNPNVDIVRIACF